MHKAFEALKNALTTTSCLQISDSNGDFEVTIDASENAEAIEVVLMQNGHPIAFKSRKLNVH